MVFSLHFYTVLPLCFSAACTVVAARAVLDGRRAVAVAVLVVASVVIVAAVDLPHDASIDRTAAWRPECDGAEW